MFDMFLILVAVGSALSKRLDCTFLPEQEFGGWSFAVPLVSGGVGKEKGTKQWCKLDIPDPSE